MIPLSSRPSSMSSTYRSDLLRLRWAEFWHNGLLGALRGDGLHASSAERHPASVFGRPSLRLSCRLTGLVLLNAALFLLAILIQSGGVIPAAAWRSVGMTLPIVVGCNLAAFLATGRLRKLPLGGSFVEVAALVEVATLGAVGLLILGLLFNVGGSLSFPIIVTNWVLTALAFVGFQVSSRLIQERYAPMLGRKVLERVLVVGATEDTAAVIRVIHQEQRFGLKVVGIIDPDHSALGRLVAGVEVVGSLDEVGRLAIIHRIASVVIPSANVSNGGSSPLVNRCREAGLLVRSIPRLESLIQGKVAVRPRDVDPTELLCREPVDINGESIGELLRGGVVLVTGAAGSIGSEICRQILTFSPRRIILVDVSENGLFFLERELRDLDKSDAEVIPFPASITDITRLRAAFDRYLPTVVFHAAAHKHVPMMEAHPGEAVKNNVFGTKAVVDEAIRAKVKSFVLISTDKAVRPTSVMGACKRLAEIYTSTMSRTTSTRLVAVRFGNVIGSAGSVVPIFKQQIQAGGPLTITHPEMTRYFMSIPEAARLVLQAGAIAKSGEIFLLEMGKPVKISNLARNLIRLSGLEEGRDIEIVYTGIRPGEKLHEDLCEADEESVPTDHPKIVRLCHTSTSLADLRQNLDRLARSTDAPSETIIRLLSEIVPGYQPQGCEIQRPLKIAGSTARQRAVAPVAASSL